MTKTRSLLALTVAVCALTVVVAPASAFFHAASYPAKVHGQGGEQKFKAGGGIFVCKGIHLFGETQVSQDSSQQKLAATYVGCTSEAFGFKGTATVVMHSCQYDFHQAKGATSGQVSVSCPAGQKIQLETGLLGCVIEVGQAGNEFLKTVTYTNLATTVEGKVAVVGGITWTSNSNCQSLGFASGGNPGAGTGATYEGTATIEAQKDESPFEQVAISVI